MSKAWNSVDNAKLLKLVELEPRKGGLDPLDLNKEPIAKIIAKHWPHRTYQNLAYLIRKKPRLYNLNGSLNGKRKTTYKKGKLHWFFYYL